jgi:hypothetical protein
MEGFILAILIGLSLIFVVYTIISLLFPKRFFGHPTDRPPKSQNDDEPIVSPNNTKVEPSEYVIPKVVDYDDDVVTVKRVNFITEKLFEAGVETSRLANKLIFLGFVFPTIFYLIFRILKSKIQDDIIILSKNHSLENIQKLESLGKFMTELPQVLAILLIIYTVVGLILIIQNIYVIATILKETKKYFKFDSTKISSRSKDPYFNR